MLFDSHAHLNNKMSDKDRAAMVAAIEASDLDYVMDIGFDLASSKLAADHAAKYPWCYAAAGFHPHDAENMDDMDLIMIKGLAKKNKVMAIGEIGLTGEIRSVSHMNQRLSEAARLGFKTCIIPKSGSDKVEIPAGLKVYRVRNIREAIETAL